MLTGLPVLQAAVLLYIAVAQKPTKEYAAGLPFTKVIIVLCVVQAMLDVTAGALLTWKQDVLSWAVLMSTSAVFWVLSAVAISRWFNHKRFVLF